MSIYTKRGDKGITDMARTRNISKSDDRIQLGGAVDELSSHISLMLSIFGFVNSYDHQETFQFLETIQKNLDLITAGEEFYATMRRSTNGGGENSPKLAGEDDFYELFFASLEQQI